MDAQVQTIINELQARIEREMKQIESGQGFDVNQLALAAGPDTAGFLNLLIR